LAAVICSQASPVRPIRVHNADLIARLHFKDLAGEDDMAC
jgi:hypothetical protein